MNQPVRICAALCLSLASVAARADVDADPVTDADWQEAVVSVTDLDRTAQFFLEIGDYEVKWRGSLGRDAVAAWGLPAGYGISMNWMIAPSGVATSKTRTAP